MKVGYDPAKREATLRERGLDFDDAVVLLSGDNATIGDDRFDYGEERKITAGYLKGRMVVMVWSKRGDTIRVISMRHCHAKEEARWQRFFPRSGG